MHTEKKIHTVVAERSDSIDERLRATHKMSDLYHSQISRYYADMFYKSAYYSFAIFTGHISFLHGTLPSTSHNGYTKCLRSAPPPPSPKKIVVSKTLQRMCVHDFKEFMGRATISQSYGDSPNTLITEFRVMVHQ